MLKIRDLGVTLTRETDVVIRYASGGWGGSGGKKGQPKPKPGAKSGNKPKPKPKPKSKASADGISHGQVAQLKAQLQRRLTELN
jgi:hypothetical protein